jgi:hypothetical protein
MFVRAATHGRIQPTPPQIRKWSGNRDCPGHIGYIQTACAHYGVKVEIPHSTPTGWGRGVPWTEVLDRLARGQFVALPLTYGSLPQEDRARTSFKGHHMFLLCPPRHDPPINPHGNVKGDDPIQLIRRPYDLDHLFAAARDCADELGFPAPNVIAAFVQGVAA